MSLQDDIASIQTSQASIDDTFTQVGTELDTVQKNVQTLLGEIVSETDMGKVNQLAINASAEVAKLGTLKAALDTIATSVQPVTPVPPVEPTT